MPLFFARKEVFAWLKEGKKTVDVRKGNARRGDTAVFQCGHTYLRFPIAKKETGKLREIVRKDNFEDVIPAAATVEAAIDYLCALYGVEDGTFTAYYLARTSES